MTLIHDLFEFPWHCFQNANILAFVAQMGKLSLTFKFVSETDFRDFLVAVRVDDCYADIDVLVDKCFCGAK